ncbi:MAG TPA: tRNA guanosine(34) transglycosylase Tgt, partial [Candidatus Dormibacteraeota bacterium]|nr:tRNA guanosine(34) transglycosylase Tgt [Candidatus Dormibacteraeota bacterium]
LQSGGAAGPRAALLHLPHGIVETPAFMPVGTRGTVKAIDMRDLAGLRPGMVLANTYHLWTSPGHQAVARAGGLHGWTGWAGNFLTDSGGYQVVSLAKVGRAMVDEEGVVFDGGIRLTPEGAVQVQEVLAPDVMMVLDQPVGFPASPGQTAAATWRTHRWAARAREAWSRGPTELWGIVQGGFDLGLRRESALALRALDFPGYAIGGLSLGEPSEASGECLRVCTELLPVDRPRYLMGVGTEREMLAAIAVGVDLFDCVWPTRLARTGAALVGAGRINLVSSPFAHDFRPLEEGCGCPACVRHTRAQVRHLLRRGELLGYRLLTMHNLHHTLELARRARAAVLAGRFEEFARSRLAASAGPGRGEGSPI